MFYLYHRAKALCYVIKPRWGYSVPFQGVANTGARVRGVSRWHSEAWYGAFRGRVGGGNREVNPRLLFCPFLGSHY